MWIRRSLNNDLEGFIIYLSCAWIMLIEAPWEGCRKSIKVFFYQSHSNSLQRLLINDHVRPMQIITKLLLSSQLHWHVFYWKETQALDQSLESTMQNGKNSIAIYDSLITTFLLFFYMWTMALVLSLLVFWEGVYKSRKRPLWKFFQLIHRPNP
jgi:hypothetical protein